MSKHIFKEISVNKILPSKDNARKIDQKSESFTQLLNSIKASGVRVPIHLWPHPKKEGMFEIRAGERRWRASKHLGLETIPAIVHEGISYDEAITVTYVENKFRKPLKPLEEIAEIAKAMNNLKEPKVIAELIGQTEHWVRLRANIHKNLIQGFRQSFINQDQSQVFHSWTVGHLTLIARLPADSQKSLLAEINQFYWQWENVSVHDLENRIAQRLQLLNKAPWSLADKTLFPKAGSCEDCPKRCFSEPLLWNVTANEKNQKKDRCLSPDCWKTKTKLFLQQKAKALSEEHENLAYISKVYMNQGEKRELSETFGRVLDMDDVEKSTKGTKDAIPAMIVSGSGSGKIMYVKEKQFTRPGATGRRVRGQVTPLKERRKLLDCKRWAQLLLDLREKVEKTNVEDIIYDDKYTAVMSLVAVFGNEIRIVHDEKEVDRLMAERKKNPTAAYSEALQTLWRTFIPTLDRMLTYNGPVTQTSKHYIETAKWIGYIIQVSINDMFKEISKRKGFTEPASWKNLNADGTTKTKKTKKTKKAKKVTKSEQKTKTKKKKSA